MKDAKVADFLASFARAWNAFDVDAMVAHFALPQIIASEGQTSFLETEEEVRANIDQLIDLYDTHDVAGAVMVDFTIDPLPDAAARARVHWNLTSDTGAVLLDFHTDYTIVADDDGILAIVAIEADDEVAAWKAAGWQFGGGSPS